MTIIHSLNNSQAAMPDKPVSSAPQVVATPPPDVRMASPEIMAACPNNETDSGGEGRSSPNFSTKSPSKEATTKGEKLLPSSFQLSPYSIIIGRGRESKKALGNRRLKVFVTMHLEAYAAAVRKCDKTDIVQKVANLVREACPVGSFVRGVQGRYYEVNDAVAHEKVGYTFRELLGNKYRSSSKSKGIRRREREERLKSKQLLECAGGTWCEPLSNFGTNLSEHDIGTSFSADFGSPVKLLDNHHFPNSSISIGCISSHSTAWESLCSDKKKMLNYTPPDGPSLFGFPTESCSTAAMPSWSDNNKIFDCRVTTDHPSLSYPGLTTNYCSSTPTQKDDKPARLSLTSLSACSTDGQIIPADMFDLVDFE